MSSFKPPQTEKRKRVRPSQTTEEKARRREKLTQLTNDITLARASLHDQAKQIATTHGRSLTWTSRNLHLGGKMLKKKRAAHAWNAFVSRELQAANADLPPGSRHRLISFMKDNHASLQSKYFKLSREERENLEASLVIARLQKDKRKRTTPKAMQKDVNATFEAMDQEWDAVSARTGVEGFYMAVRGDVEHYHEPKDYFSPKARSFVQDVLGLDPGRVALQFEAYVVGGLDKVSVKPAKRSVTQEVSMCRKLIQEGLDAILAKQNVTGVTMNYANYERKIAEEWGTILEGWPEGKVTNPGALHSRQRVQRLLKALESRSCLWVKLTDSELEERIADNTRRAEAGDEVYKRRKKSAKVSAAPRSTEFIDDDDDK